MRVPVEPGWGRAVTEGDTTGYGGLVPLSHGIDFHAAYQDPDWDVVGDWPLLAVKFTEGVQYRSWWSSARDDFLRMRERAQAGRHRWICGYHVLRADFAVSDQVAHFLDAWDQVGGMQQGEFYQLDWEAWTYASPEVATSRAARRFVDEMNAAVGGVRGITYSSDWLPDSTLDSDSLAEFIEWRIENPATDEAAGLWYANYNTGQGPSDGPAEVAKYEADIWQWTSTATATGFLDPVDLNEVQPKGFALLDRLTLGTAEPGQTIPLPEEADVAQRLDYRPGGDLFVAIMDDGFQLGWISSGADAALYPPHDVTREWLVARLQSPRTTTVGPSPFSGVPGYEDAELHQLWNAAA